jgi:archaeosortase A (PGF-CTERM-specific)
MLNKPVVLLGWMMLEWLVSYLLWIGLLLLLASALARKSSIAVPGWAIFGLFWLFQPGHYLATEDYFNAVLFLAAGLMSLYMAWIVLNKGFTSNARLWASYAAAVCGIVYFPFAEIEPLQSGLIRSTTFITVQALQFISVPVIMQSWNVMSLNGRSVETSIESIALFAGLILSVQAPIGRRLMALAASTVSIYLLNIVRNGFVIMAYGGNWFGSDSFEIAHNIIAKAGSTVALLAVSYLVFLLLPELLSIIDELAADIRAPRGDAV